MSPQFVDLNADGHIDIVTGTFDGSPHVSYGGETGFAQPKHILDESGSRIHLNSYWNYDARKWVEERREEPQKSTSVFAYDWDGDGDLDLLLGDYLSGNVLLVRNQGSKAKARFSTERTRVQAGGKPIKLRHKVATLRMIDWDGDGHRDLMVGSFGVTSLRLSGGEIRWFRNTAKAKATELADGVVLVSNVRPRAGVVTGPGAGYYFDATDYDGDGDLDLLIGGKTMVLPVARELSASEADRVRALRAEQKTDRGRRRKIRSAAKAASRDATGGVDQEKYRELLERHKVELDTIEKRALASTRELGQLDPTPRVENLVWLYRNRGRSR